MNDARSRECSETSGCRPSAAIRLFAVETHPIQYKAPLFRAVAALPEVDLTVLFAMVPDADQQGAGFGVAFEWDLPLVEGYRHEVLDNRARHPSVTRFSGCDTPGMVACLRRERPDVVLVNGWVAKSCLQALWACRRLGIPCMVRGEANLLRPRGWWKHALHRILLRQYEAYLAIGTANEAFYRFHGCHPARIFPAPYGVDHARFAAAAHALQGTRDKIREDWKIPADALVVLFAGKMERKKHPEDVLLAVALLPEALRSRVHVLFAGSGPELASCREMAAARQVRATFAGFLNQLRMPQAYAAADVLVLPSDAGETWGLVVNEAMASGRPALISRAAGCCGDLIVEGQTGYSFACHDVADLSRRIKTYLSEPRSTQRQGAFAARHIRAFDPACAAQGILAAARASVLRRKAREEAR